MPAPRPVRPVLARPSPSRGAAALVALLVALGAGADAGAQGAPARGRGATAAGAAARPGRAAPRATRRPFFRLTAPNGRAFHLLGSIHALTRDAYPLPPAVERAFAASRYVAFELDMDSMRTQLPQLSHSGLITDGRTLSQLISPDTDSLLRARLPALGVHPAQVQPFKPWVVMMFVGGLSSEKAGLRARYGVDEHYFRRARAGGKGVVALESVAYQHAIFDGLSAEEQDDLLWEALADADNATAVALHMKAAWFAGDTAALEAISNRFLARRPALRARLLGDRNRHWVTQIEQVMRTGEPTFVVVGAGHLTGPDGLLALFAARGYRIEQP